MVSLLNPADNSKEDKLQRGINRGLSRALENKRTWSYISRDHIFRGFNQEEQVTCTVKEGLPKILVNKEEKVTFSRDQGNMTKVTCYLPWEALVIEAEIKKKQRFEEDWHEILIRNLKTLGLKFSTVDVSFNHTTRMNASYLFDYPIVQL